MAKKEKAMGSLKKIYIIHGWSYSTNKWGPFVELLKKNGFSVNLLKVPGLTAASDKVWELDDYIVWLKKNISDEKNKIILLGHSNGGRIAISYASLYPEDLSHLLLIDSAGIYHNEIPIRIKRIVFKTIAKLGKKATTSNQLKKLIYRLAQAKDYQEATSSMKQTMLNLIIKDLTPILITITTPTTIIWGEKDKITPLSDAKLMNKYIKNSRFYQIKDAKHSPQFSHPQEVIDRIKKEV